MINRYFSILRLVTVLNEEFIIFDDVLETEDLQEWAKVTHEATNKPLKGINSCECVGEAFDYLEDILLKELRAYNIAPEVAQVLKSYYKFHFRAYSKDFRDSEDIDGYNEDLFDVLAGSRAKNFEPLESVGAISSYYFELIAEMLYIHLKDYKLDIIDQFNIIGAFCEAYEGVDPQSEEFLKECRASEDIPIYRGFFKDESLGELLDHFAYWFDSFLNVDDEGEPLGESDPKDFILDCLNWRGL